MTDSRFTTVVDDCDELLDVMDVDDVSDIETLLIVLTGRPISVGPLADGDDDDDSLGVTVWVDEVGFGARYGFPMSMMDLARAFGSQVADLAPVDGDDLDSGGEYPDLVSMGDDALITTLQRALGQVRLFNLLSTEE